MYQNRRLKHFVFKYTNRYENTKKNVCIHISSLFLFLTLANQVNNLTINLIFLSLLLHLI